MARTQLRGFRYNPPGSDESRDKKVLDLLEKKYLNRTESGQFENISQIDDFLGVLNTLPQSLDVQEKTADLTNKRLQFSSRQDDILNSKALFEDDLNDKKRLVAAENYKDLPNLVAGYMNIYADAEEKLDNYIAKNVYEKYGANATIPNELIDMKNNIKDKARYYSTLQALAFNPETFATVDTDALAVKLNTNPLTGKIIDIDVVPRNEIDVKKFMQTDIKAKVYDAANSPTLNYFINTGTGELLPNGKVAKTAKLGSIDFRGVGANISQGDAATMDEAVGIGILKAQNRQSGAWDWIKSFFTESPEEVQDKAVDAAQDVGITLKDFSFDGNDIPNGRAVRKGNKLYYQTSTGDVVGFDGKSYEERKKNAEMYIKQEGGDPSVLQSPYYADDTYFVKPDGSSKVKGSIGPDYFKVRTQPTSLNLPASPQPLAVNSEQPSATSFFESRVNRPNKPNTVSASIGGQPSAPDIIDKGKGFFRNRV